LKWIDGGRVLAVGTSAQVLLFSGLKSGKFSIKQVWEMKHPILSISFSPNGRWLMTGTQDNAVHVTNCENNQEFHMSGYPGKVRQTAWHKGNRWFATNGVKEAILIWDCAGRGPEGRQPAILEGHFDQVTALQFKTQGDFLASGAKDGGVTFWNPNQYNPKLTGAKIASGVSHLAWAPKADLLAVGGDEGDIQVLGI
jgi:WD40 repeat protein